MQPGKQTIECNLGRPQTPKAKKLCFEKSRIKSMLVAFFDFRWFVHKEIVPTGQTVNDNFYKDNLDHLIERINRVRPDLRMSGDHFLRHDNSSAHNMASVRQFLAKKMLQSFTHTPPPTIHLIWLRFGSC